MNKKQLLEVVKETVKEGLKYFKIMTPPFDEGDFRELLKMSSGEVRFIADAENKKIYLFDGSLLHYRAAAEIGISYPKGNPAKMTSTIFGIGYWNPDKKILQFEESFNLSETQNFARTMKDWRKAFYKIADANWKFKEANEYISGMTEEVNRLKKEIKTIEARQ